MHSVIAPARKAQKSPASELYSAADVAPMPQAHAAPAPSPRLVPTDPVAGFQAQLQDSQKKAGRFCGQD
ncbi:hypothetical protein LX32DRAFT_646159 [Colletotrichum zoysiae]|uniref:Uncharacterized protein n=1 Tax=Colletotrichum zoysiae TaxID=1216348 RepID=A0AAD9H3P6_9PEZI|nr:hypothetical protein LX32DRAFT_646159 [Colletotrichum zoysiae]